MEPGSDKKTLDLDLMEDDELFFDDEVQEGSSPRDPLQEPEEEVSSQKPTKAKKDKKYKSPRCCAVPGCRIKDDTHHMFSVPCKCLLSLNQ